MADFFVFDTNTLMSAFLFKNSVPRKALRKAARFGRLVASGETYTEFENVFWRAKFDKYLTSHDRQEAFMEINDITIFFKIQEHITACCDPRDNKFLELAVSAKASCIITGDEDLLILHPFRAISILNAADFQANY